MSIEAVIVAHPRRSQQAFDLAMQIGVSATRIIVDHEGLGDWGNHRAALHFGVHLNELGARASHLLVLEDDAVPVPNLLAEVGKAVAAYPDGPISLYVGTGRPRQLGVQKAIKVAELQGSNWLEADDMLWGVGYVLPVVDIPDLLAYADELLLPSDQRVGAFYRRRGQMVRYTWPSLVDHADGPSVIPNRPRPFERKAWAVGTVDRYVGEPVIIARS